MVDLRIEIITSPRKNATLDNPLCERPHPHEFSLYYDN
jgi:hypothetical protein